MALTLGHQVSSTDTTITIGVTQGTLPGNFFEDRFYAVTEYTTSEPSTPAATLTSGGHTSVTLTGLTPDRNYWIVAWRHFNDATPAEQASGPAWVSVYSQSDYQTTSDTATYSPPASTTWTEDWSSGMTKWIDEYPVFSPPYFRTYVDDGIMGSRYLRSTVDQWRPWPTSGSNVGCAYHSRQYWDHTRPLDVSFKIRTSSGQPMGAVGVHTTEWSYYTVGNWWWTSPSGKVMVNVNTPTDSPSYTQTLSTNCPTSGPQTWRITHDGSGNWRTYIDGSPVHSGVWMPEVPVGLWLGINNGTDIGQITVSGTPLVYVSLGGMDHFQRWSGTHSCREDMEWLTPFSSMGGLTGPNTLGSKVSIMDTQYGTPVTYQAGSWTARSPKFRGVSQIKYAGRVANGTLQLVVKRAADDSTLATLSPSGSSHSLWGVPNVNQWDDLYLVVNGVTSLTGSDASVLHYVSTVTTTLPQVSLTLGTSSTWIQSGTSITVRGAQVGTRSTVQATVVTSAGGRMVFSGTHAARFEASLDGSTWSSSVVVPAGTSTVYLGCTRQAGDPSLTAQVGIPA